MMSLTKIRHLLVHQSLRSDSDILSGHLTAAVGAVVGFLVMNSLLTGVYIIGFNDGVAEIPPGVQFLASGIALLVPVVIIWWWLDLRERTAAFPFRHPSTTEFMWTIAFVPLAIGASSLGILVGEMFGLEYMTFDYDLTDPVTAAGVLIGPILLAPILEEALFRGLLLGSLIDRGWSPRGAGVVAVLVFAGPHIWLGFAGMMGIAAWAVFPTILRLKFDSLTGASLLHLLNNIYSYIVVVVGLTI